MQALIVAVRSGAAIMKIIDAVVCNHMMTREDGVGR
jgi:hypothetical protein